MIEKILENVSLKIKEILKEMGVTEEIEVLFEVPKEEAFGDYSTNVAMRMARSLHKAPVVIATELLEKMDLASLHLEKAEVKGAGFINFFLDKKYLTNVAFKILKEKEHFGDLNIGEGKKYLLEYVSANPTGFLHVGHGRGAAYGDSLARIMKKAGYVVGREHYVNDAGNQIHNMTESIHERYKELLGLECNLLEDYYHGKEIIDIAKMIKEEKGDYYLNNPYYDDFRKFGLNYLLDGLKKDLKDFNVEFDTWFSEKSLYDSGDVEKTLEFLKEKGYTYVSEGALWLKTSERGDEKDRVLVKSDGSLTYFTPDIAYHKNKLSRGYDHLIDVLGADHHGYIPRLKAAISFVGGDPNLLDVEILQMVRVLENGEEVKMSKRSGKAITLRDLINEVGTDALRFMYSSKSLSTHMDLDIDLMKKNTNENPVYYVQYAYARISGLFRTLEENGKDFELVSEFNKLNYETSYKLIKVLLQYPSYVLDAATKRIPHKISQYALLLATALHSYYNDEKIISEDKELTNEKLTLLKAVQIVLKDSLGLLGVNVKERM